MNTATDSRNKFLVIGGILIAVYLLLQSLIPLRSAVQIGADEGFEVAKATLCAHGYKLYSEVWNDQPPLHTFLTAQVLKYFTPSILGPRLITTAFTVVMLTSVFLIVRCATGLLTAALTTALVIASPGFLELSSSCMLEIPALATALAGISILLVLPESRWRVAEFLCGILFGVAALMKLVPLYLLPLAALVLWLREWSVLTAIGVEKGGSESKTVQLGLSKPELVSTSLRRLFVPLLIIGASLCASMVLVDWLIEKGAFIANFQQSWTSHFGAAKSFEYGSPSDHGFEWSLLLKNWDTTLPAVVGVCALISGVRKNPMKAVPVVWLALALAVFTNHKPWWAYYFVHIAIPLCWCAAIGFELVANALVARLGHGDRKRNRGKVWRRIGGVGAAGLAVLLTSVWMSARVYLQISSIRDTPQLHAALVLKEIERLKPFTQFMYTDQLVYSFHADIPMPPPLAVVPLKRLWAGEMTSERIAAEISRFQPGIVLLRNDNRRPPFQDLLNAEYRMIYQDDRHRLYGKRTTLQEADTAELRGSGLTNAGQ